MSTLLAIDPGIRGVGAAWFSNGELGRCEYVKNPEKKGGHAYEAAAMALAVRAAFEEPDHIAVEWPRIYVDRFGRLTNKMKADPNDLLALTAIDTAIVALFAVGATSYEPAHWKQQLKHEALEAKVRSRLGTLEATLLDRTCEIVGAKNHNVVDAVGIGLHHVGRFERKRVIAT